MILLTLLNSLKGTCQQNLSLAPFTRLRVGGAAEIFYKPFGTEELSYFLSNLSLSIPITVIGNGSNVLIRDGGIPGVVIKLGKSFANITIDEKHIYAGSATLNYTLAQFCLQHSIADFAFLMGIPGSIGGSCIMNAGCYGQEFKDILIAIKVIDRKGKIYSLEKSDISFSYRNTNIPPDLVIIEAKFCYHKGNFDHIHNKMLTLAKTREQTQPVKTKTAGSTFTNPANYKAWQLIDNVGGKLLQVGDAIWSPIHRNFLLNLGNATASNIEELGELTRQKVLQQTGIQLEWEVKRLGMPNSLPQTI